MELILGQMTLKYIIRITILIINPLRFQYTISTITKIMMLMWPQTILMRETRKRNRKINLQLISPKLSSIRLSKLLKTILLHHHLHSKTQT